MKRSLLATIFCLTLMVTGCGSEFSAITSSGPVTPSPTVLGRALLVANADTDRAVSEKIAAAIDGLGVTRAGVVYTSIAQWSDNQPDLTGTLRQACGGVKSIVNSPQLGPDAVYTVLSLLRADAGQGFSTSLGGTLDFPDSTSAQRGRDSMMALVAPPIQDRLNDVVAANLGSNLSSMVEFQGLRILNPTTMPRRKRDGLANTRMAIPLPVVGTPMQKAIKIADMNNYLNGTFDPTVGGFASVADQATALVTPRQIIDGLRLDYPGGFQNETRVALLQYPDTVNMTYLVPFAPPMGGVFSSVYPFTGTGYTSTIEARTVPEVSQPPGTRTRLPAGCQLVEVDPLGTRIPRGTLAQNGTWTPALPKLEARTPLDQKARYKGIVINLTSTDGEFYWVGSFGTVLPQGFLLEMRQVGNLEYLGKVRVNDPGLSIESK